MAIQLSLKKKMGFVQALFSPKTCFCVESHMWSFLSFFGSATFKIAAALLFAECCEVSVSKKIEH